MIKNVLKEAEERILYSKDKVILLESGFIAMYSLFCVFCCIVEAEELELSFIEEVIDYEPSYLWPYSREEMISELLSLYDLVKWDSFISLNYD